MKYDDMIQRANKLREEANVIRNSQEYRDVVAVLSGLGFLVALNVVPNRRSKVNINTALEVGKLEPRILEVLPAAVIASPTSFSHLNKAPKEFKDVVNALRLGIEGTNLGPIPFSKILEATNR